MNRSLAYHQLDDQVKVIEDADYVIENLDANNFKALMRRAHAFRTNFRFDLALRDLKKLKSLMKIRTKKRRKRTRMLQ